MKLASNYSRNYSKNQSVPYSKICSTKIISLTIAPVLFISVGFFCKFAMLPDLYILLSLSGKGGSFFFFGVQMNTSLSKKM